MPRLVLLASLVASTVAFAQNDDLYLQPVSGNARQRAVPLPAKFKASANGGAINGAGLFDAAHPSRFAFLRKDVLAISWFGGEGEQKGHYKRTLQKGEAVLPISDGSASPDKLKVLAIDGAEAMVATEDLAIAPVAGTKVAVLKSTDLPARSDDGELLALPVSAEADESGFKLEWPNKWIDLLDPPEPASQKFIDAKTKVVGCYKKQMEQLDPKGTLRKYYDVVTYKKGDIDKVESAADALDRKACKACGCKAFNEMKRKLVTQAIAPLQKKAFAQYQPVLEKLSKTDFAAASKGAPKGVAPKAGSEEF